MEDHAINKSVAEASYLLTAKVRWLLVFDDACKLVNLGLLVQDFHAPGGTIISTHA